MAVNWWERVDREEPIERAHALWGSPGLLVVRGSDATERGVVAKLIEERLGESGQCARGIDTSYGAPLAGALLDVWSKLAPREPGTIPDWVRYAGRPVPELCRRLADYQATQHRPGAVVLEEVDSTDRWVPSPWMRCVSSLRGRSCLS